VLLPLLGSAKPRFSWLAGAHRAPRAAFTKARISRIVGQPDGHWF